MRYAAVHESGSDAVDGSSTGTRVPRMWALLRLPRFRGASHADDHDNRSRHCQVDALWRGAFPNDNPWNVAEISIPEKLRTQPELLLVAIQCNSVVGSIMAGYDGHRGWISRIEV